MKFDRTLGKEAKYLVTIAWGMTTDHYYYDSFARAKSFYENAIGSHSEMRAVSVYDIKKDVRKLFWKNN